MKFACRMDQVHRTLWPILALAIGLGFVMALVLRPPPDTEAPLGPRSSCHERRFSRGAMEPNETRMTAFCSVQGRRALHRHVHPIVFWLEPPRMCRTRSTSAPGLRHLRVPHAHGDPEIGPLARLNRRFLPLLHNRRHFGVLTFFVAAAARMVHVRLVHGAEHSPNLYAN